MPYPDMKGGPLTAEKSYIARTSGLKARDYLGYAMVDAAGCLVFSLVTTLLQKFYTDIFHLSPLFIMLMFIGARIWDGINDPIMGGIIEMSVGVLGEYIGRIYIEAKDRPIYITAETNLDKNEK